LNSSLCTWCWVPGPMVWMSIPSSSSLYSRPPKDTKLPSSATWGAGIPLILARFCSIWDGLSWSLHWFTPDLFHILFQIAPSTWICLVISYGTLKLLWKMFVWDCLNYLSSISMAWYPTTGFSPSSSQRRNTHSVDRIDEGEQKTINVIGQCFGYDVIVLLCKLKRICWIFLIITCKCIYFC